MEAAAFCSDPIRQASGTRAIETARFSPLVEAIMQRAAYSVVARGVHSALYADAQIVGFASTEWPLAVQPGGTVTDWDGAAAVGSGAGAVATTPFGAAENGDSSGRTVTRNGGTLSSSTAVTAAAMDRSAAYLARNGGNYAYGHGLYDFVGISPERLTNAQLQALAVAA